MGHRIKRWFAVAAAILIPSAVMGVFGFAIWTDPGARDATYSVPIRGLPEIHLRSKGFVDIFGYVYLRDGWNPIPRQLCELPGWWVLPHPPPRAFPPRAGWSYDRPPGTSAGTHPYGVHWSADGRRLAVSSEGWFFCAYDRRTGETISYNEAKPVCSGSGDAVRCLYGNKLLLYVDQKIDHFLGPDRQPQPSRWY